MKFLMSVLKWQVNSSSNFALFFIAMLFTSSVNFKVITFLLWTKGSHQSPNFDTFKCSGENLPDSSHFPSNKSIFLQILHYSSMSWEITPMYFFSSNNIHLLQKSSAQVKICQIPYANFETTSRSSSPNFVSLFSFMKDNFYMYFLPQTIYTLLKRTPLKWKILRLLSDHIKICEILYVSFEMTSQFLSKFCISLQFHQR